jgi:hypothetical protein
MLALLIGSLLAGAIRAQDAAAPTRHINERLAAAWKANDLEPSDRATDLEFLRRASLDIIGRIATPGEIRTFEKDPPADRRSRLVERLLASDEYARYWAELWTVWLIDRSGEPSAARDQLRQWLEEQFAKNVSHKEMIEKLLTATGKATDNGAVHYTLAHLGTAIPASRQAEEGQFDMVPLTSRTVRLTLGYDFRCIQCHDHPLDPDWKQQHFWQINAFFRQVERKPGPGAGGAVLELCDNPELNASGKVVYEKRNGRRQTAGATFLDGRQPPADPKRPRRQALARFLTGHENFARAFVNRMWGQFFGRGLNETPAVDDFGTHNPLVHEELLDRLAKEFVAGGYDPKKLIRWICASDAYQLSSIANASNKAEAVEVFFSRMPLRPLSPEQLHASVLAATHAQTALSKEERAKLGEEWQKAFHAAEAAHDRQGMCSRGFGRQEIALLTLVPLLNLKEVNDAVTSTKGGTVAETMATAPTRVLDELYLATLNRRPTAREVAVISREIARSRAGGGVTPVYQDVLWALLNSNEFILNH